MTYNIKEPTNPSHPIVDTTASRLLRASLPMSTRKRHSQNSASRLLSLSLPMHITQWYPQKSASQFLRVSLGMSRREWYSQNSASRLLKISLPMVFIGNDILKSRLADFWEYHFLHDIPNNTLKSQIADFWERQCQWISEPTFEKIIANEYHPMNYWDCLGEKDFDTHRVLRRYPRSIFSQEKWFVLQCVL